MEWRVFKQYNGLTDMTARKTKLRCESARDCYFSLLFPDEGEPVSEKVRRHVAGCPYCSERLQQIREMLGSLVQFGRDRQYYIRQLVRHFSLAKTEVGCGQAKKLLPLLADPRFNIPVPTPVTVHVDQCPQCKHDLKTLKSLGLSTRQLVRLGEFFAQKSFDGDAGCVAAGEHIIDVAQMRLDGIESGILDHVCLCRKCRAAVYDERLRLKSKKTAFEEEIVPLPCRSIEQIDLYDYVVPFGLDGEQDSYVRTRGSLAGHLRQCPACIEKMRQLHNIVYTIDNRGDSGIATWYELSPAKAVEGFEEIAGQYSDWPVNVQVATRTVEEAVATVRTVSLAGRVRKRVSQVNVARLIKPIGVAAAIMMFAAIFFGYAPTSQAVTLAEVYQAVGNVSNVCISRFRSGESEPWRKTWMSRDKGIRLHRDKDETLLSDTNNLVRRVKRTNKNDVVVSQLDTNVAADIQTNIEKSFGIMPFLDQTKVPTNAVWNKVGQLEASVPPIEVYELNWISVGGLCRVWKGYIDVRSNLPLRVESYIVEDGERDCVLQFWVTIEYLSDDEFAAVLANAFE